MRIKRDRHRSVRSIVLTVLLIVILFAVAAFSLAFVWQNAQEGGGVSFAEPFSSQESDLPIADESSEFDNESDSLDNSSQDVSTQPLIESSDLVSSPPSSSESGGESTTDAHSFREPLIGALPESPKVDNVYFSDAIFFGDSLSTGIPIYQVAGSPDTVAVKGLSPFNILDPIDLPTGENMTVLEKAAEFGEKKKVYIMLGSNGLWQELDAFIKDYKAFLVAVKQQYPDSVIYLQTMLPVTIHAKTLYPTADNEVIRNYNEAIAKLAQTSGVHLVDVAMALIDEEGNLPLEASPTDGMHLTPEYYQKWFDYLKAHTLEEKAT